MQIKIFGMLICMLFFGASVVPCISGDIEIGKNSVLNQNNATSSVSNAVDWWPMFRHDPCHTGISSFYAPSTNNILWKTGSTGNVVFSPAIADGKVYFGGCGGFMYCLDAGDGTFKWSQNFGGCLCSSPAVASVGGILSVYFGQGINITCCNANSGVVLWTYLTGSGSPICSSPTIDGGYLYIGAPDGKVYCLDAATGKKNWIVQTGWPIYYSSPAVYGGKVYINIAGRVFCLDAANGNLLWVKIYGGTTDTSPAISNNRLYVGDANGRLYCLDIANKGNILWNYQTGDTISSSPAIARTNIGRNMVIFGSDDDKVYCLDADTGGFFWSYQTGGPIGLSSPAADKNAYETVIGSTDGRVYCLDWWGKVVWSYNTGAPIIGSPAIYGNRVYIGSGYNDNILYCFGAINGCPLPPKINGTIHAKVGIPHDYIFNAIDPDGDDVRYLIEWGDGNHETTGLNSSGTNVTVSHTWGSEGIYTITAYAEDMWGAMSPESQLEISVELNNAPLLPGISGKSSGKAGVSYDYIFNAIDPDGDDIRYFIDWGDGNSVTTGLNLSGTNVTVSHTWSSTGTYVIKAKAQDEYGLDGPEATLSVTMPKNKAINYAFLDFLYQKFPLIAKILQILS